MNADANVEIVAVMGAGGTMGFGMARNLCRAGLEVRAWNRSREKAQPLEEHGVLIAGSPAEAANGADAMITMLSDADAVLSVAREALTGNEQQPRVWIQTSTIGERGTATCIELAEQRGIAFVDAPVLGTKQPAAEGKLIVMASGPERLRGTLEPVFDAIGQRTVWVGEAGAGSRLKLATNAWIVTVVEGGAELLALAGALELDPMCVLDVLSGGSLDLPYLQQKGRAMLAHDFEPSFTLRLAAKDAGLVVDAAASRGLDLPLLRSVRERFEQSVPDHGDQDMSAVYLTLDGERPRVKGDALPGESAAFSGPGGG